MHADYKIKGINIRILYSLKLLLLLIILSIYDYIEICSSTIYLSLDSLALTQSKKLIHNFIKLEQFTSSDRKHNLFMFMFILLY